MSKTRARGSIFMPTTLDHAESRRGPGLDLYGDAQRCAIFHLRAVRWSHFE